jgi:hypothetical protein
MLSENCSACVTKSSDDMISLELRAVYCPISACDSQRATRIAGHANMTILRLEVASRIVGGALKRAAELVLKPMTVAVLDSDP